MATLTLTSKDKTVTDTNQIIEILKPYGVLFENWEASTKLSIDDSQETILKAYEHKLNPFMEKNGFESADVINVDKSTPNIETIREKFLAEHTHSEDEVRFFVDGEGYFYFHFTDEVVKLHCVAGDFISVPAGYKHWFDLAPAYSVKAIRVFSNTEGWVANYTGSEISKKYIKG